MKIETRIKKIEFIGDDLQTADIHVTFKTGSEDQKAVFNYHGALVSFAQDWPRASHLKAFTRILDKIEQKNTELLSKIS